MTIRFNESYVLKKRFLSSDPTNKLGTLEIPNGTELTSLIPNQIENEKLASTIKQSFTYSVYTLFSGSVASNIFLQTSLLSIWGLLTNLQLLGVLSVIAIPIAGEPSLIIETIMKIAMIDIIPTDKIQQRILYIEDYEDEPLNSYF